MEIFNKFRKLNQGYIQCSSGRISVVLADINNFRAFNDAYGHLVGDEVLRQFCAGCRGELREYDLFARYGGEEFAIVLPETGAEEAEEAEAVTEKLRLPWHAADLNTTWNSAISPPVSACLPCPLKWATSLKTI